MKVFASALLSRNVFHVFSPPALQTRAQYGASLQKISKCTYIAKPAIVLPGRTNPTHPFGASLAPKRKESGAPIVFSQFRHDTLADSFPAIRMRCNRPKPSGTKPLCRVGHTTRKTGNIAMSLGNPRRIYVAASSINRTVAPADQADFQADQ